MDDVLAECLQPLPFKHPVAELNMKHCRGALNMKCGTVQKWKQSKESWGIQSFGWRDKYSVILSNLYELKKLCFMTAKAML